MFKKIFTLFLVLTILLSCVAFADEVSKEDEKYKELEQTIESLKERNELLFDVVVWVFGITLTIIFALIGFIGYFNNRSAMSKLDKKISEMDSKNQRLIGVMETKNKKQNEEIDENFERHRTNIVDLLESRFEQIEDRVMHELKKQLDYETSDIKIAIKELKIDLWDFQAKSKEETFPVFLYSQIVKEANGYFMKEFMIADILEQVEKKLDEGKKLDPWDEEMLNNLITHVPEKYGSQKDRVVKKLRAL